MVFSGKKEKRFRRHRRIRAKISGTEKLPRLCVFKSLKHIYVQLIDDENQKTLAAANDLELKGKKKSTKVVLKSKSKKKGEKEQKKPGKIAIAYEVGKLIAQKALQKKIEKVIFDRGGYQYHGRVKSLADGAREAGLKF